MGKAAPDVVLDAPLDKVATATAMVACTGQPANYAGIAAVALADVTLTAGDGNGDFTIADHTSGRKLTIAAQSAVDIDTSGTATHIALHDGSTLLWVTTCGSQALVDTGTVTFPEWKITNPDPV